MIVTRNAALNISWDNTYPLVSKSWNNQELVKDIYTILDAFMFKNILDVKVPATLDSMHKEHSQVNSQVLRHILHPYLNLTDITDPISGFNQLIFSDRRIGKLGVCNSDIDADNAVNVASRHCKHMFDVATLYLCTTISQAVQLYFQFANSLMTWVHNNNYTSKNIIWDGVNCKYIELFLDETPSLSNIQRSNAVTFIEKSIRDANYYLKHSLPKGITIKEVVR